MKFPISKGYEKEDGNVIPTSIFFHSQSNNFHSQSNKYMDLIYVIQPLRLSHMIFSISNIIQVFIWGRKKKLSSLKLRSSYCPYFEGTLSGIIIKPSVLARQNYE